VFAHVATDSAPLMPASAAEERQPNSGQFESSECAIRV
jgi:hypothetical protein